MNESNKSDNYEAWAEEVNDLSNPSLADEIAELGSSVKWKEVESDGSLVWS